MGISSSIFSSTSRTDFQPNPDEISKAVVLSSLVYLDNAERKVYLDNAERKTAFKSRYSNIGLENIVMAPDFILGECKQNNSSTLFVAFRWQFCIQDMFSLKVAGINDFTKSYGTAVGKDVRGLFHNQLFQRTTDYLPSMSYFNDFKADKIIFAGHGLAGSLAHLFLICYMLNTREEAKSHISIAFGSPNFCDSDAKLFCGKTMELDKRMFTLVNGADPVPSLLTGMRITVTSNQESVESTMAEKLSSCLDGLNSWLNPANSKEKIEIKASVLESLNTFVEEIQSIDHSRCPHYIAVGAYCKGKELNSVNPVAGVKLTDVSAWNCHRVECYVEEFSISTKKGECPIIRITEESGPCINACSFNIYHGPKNHEGVIAIRGFALSNRKKLRVVPNVGREWKVECSNDSSIVLITDLSETEVFAMRNGKNDDNSEQTHLSLYLRTYFGSIEADVQLEDAWRYSYVAYALNRAMGRLLLMQQSSEDLTGSEEYREAYGALDCVFRDTLDLSEKTKLEYCETVKLQLTAPVETPVSNSLVQKFKDGYNFAGSAQGLASKFYVFLSTSLRSCPDNLCPVIPGNSCISRFAKLNESSSNENNSYVYCISDKKLRKLNYLDILRTIYCLLSGDTEESKHQQSLDAIYYEKNIYRHVHTNGPRVNRRQGLPEGIVTDITYRFAFASLDLDPFPVFLSPRLLEPVESKMTKAQASMFVFMILVSVMPSSIACGYCPPPSGGSGQHPHPPKGGGGGSPPKTPKPPTHVPTPSVPAPKTPKPPVVKPPPSGGSGGYPPYVPKPPSGGSPSVPTPSIPTPSIPTPSIPTPSIPTPSVPTPSIPSPSNSHCPKDTLKLGACVDLLGGLVHVIIGDPVVNECCPLIQGLAGLEAALCLCTAIRAKLLNLNIYLPLSLELLATCGLTPPPGFKCPEAT